MKKKKLKYGISIFSILIVLLFILINHFNTPSEKLVYIKPNTSQVVEIPSLGEKEGTVKYVEVVNGCNSYFVGDCVNMRSGPGTEYPVIVHLRTGVVLRVGDVVTRNGVDWYKVVFSHELLYPERVKGDWYVAKEFVELITDKSDHALKKGEIATSTKRIIIDLSEEKLYAYDGDKLFMEELISTGLEFTPTPKGTFTIFKMTPSRFMQGPIPGVSDQKYDLPGVPWNLYFTAGGAVIHGTYWHDKFGKPWSHGCVNLSPQNAKKLYSWVTVGVKVTVQK